MTHSDPSVTCLAIVADESRMERWGGADADGNCASEIAIGEFTAPSESVTDASVTAS